MEPIILASMFGGLMVSIILFATLLAFGTRNHPNRPSRLSDVAITALALLLLDIVAVGNVVGFMIYPLSLVVLAWFIISKTGRNATK